MSMTEQFFSVQNANRKDLFEGLSIWKDKKYHQLQGTYLVISLSFANIKEPDYLTARQKICQILEDLYIDHSYLLDGSILRDGEKEFFRRITISMDDVSATLAVHHLSKYLYQYYGKRVIILLDEYDTPIQEAYIHGYWKELVNFTRSLFNSTFKTNPWLERGIMTGITTMSKESVFSDLNSLEVVTTTSEKYETIFGFTEQEVFMAMDEYGLKEKEKVKKWYDGFVFGECRDIYNPWSILNYLKKRKFMTYWANTSSNALVGKLIREGSRDVKIIMEDLLQQNSFYTQIDEQIVFSQLNQDESAIWSFLLAAGYLRVENFMIDEKQGQIEYELKLTNTEIQLMFEQMIKKWFIGSIGASAYNSFTKALLQNDKKAMNIYMNEVALTTFSFLGQSTQALVASDTGKSPSKRSEPERFYHGFVLGLIVELADRYIITSNKESEFGRYDVMLEPKTEEDNAVILEFKVYDADEENSLKDTVKAALQQIEDKKYATTLEAKGISADRIRKYGFAFEGKRVLIG